MLTSKQRAYLRGLANKMETTVQVGKAGVTPELTESLNEALEARELVKVHVLNNSLLDVRETAEMLRGRTRSEVVTVVGSKIVLYRRSRDKSVIEF